MDYLRNRIYYDARHVNLVCLLGKACVEWDLKMLKSGHYLFLPYAKIWNKKENA